MSAELKVGEVVSGKYRLDAHIATGSTSDIFKVHHTITKRVVAIKFLKLELIRDIAAIKAFREEAKMTSRISHPNVVSLYDFGITSNGRPFLCMEVCQGDTIEQLLSRQGKIENRIALPILSRICAALEHMHQVGVVHAGINPTEIIVDNEMETLKIIDFGAARMLGQDQVAEQPIEDLSVHARFKSPEQCRGLPLDVRTDVYSLGWVMYEVVTGTPHKRGLNAQPALALKGVPTEFESILTKALDPEPEKRYQSMSEMKQSLELIATGLK